MQNLISDWLPLGRSPSRMFAEKISDGLRMQNLNQEPEMQNLISDWLPLGRSPSRMFAEKIQEGLRMQNLQQAELENLTMYY